MNIFVIGKSRVGKSTVGRALVQRLQEMGVPATHIQASEWIKAENPQLTPTVPNYRELITARSIQRLQEDPDSCSKFIRRKYNLELPHVIDGVRNPRDFMSLFNLQSDHVVFLEGEVSEHSPFDAGMDVIKAYTEFLVLNKLATPEQFSSHWIDL